MDISQILIDNRNLNKWNDNIYLIESGIYLNDTNLQIDTLRKIIDEYYMAAYYIEDYKKCINIIKKYEEIGINEHIINNTDFILQYLRKDKKVIATTDIKRIPKNDEIIIIYGDFPWIYENLIISNPCYRHFKYFNKIRHDTVESHECWNSVDKIYIINLDHRSDKYLETVSELTKLQVPLDKVERFSAILSKEWGCTASHLEVLKNSIKNKYNNILVLEDDFKLTSLHEKHKDNINKFFKDKYDYDICFVGCHVSCRYIEKDDLLYQIKARCTTTVGYFLSKNGMEKLLPIWEKALPKLKETGNDGLYACDMSWQCIQGDKKIFLFKNKIGYQRPQSSYNNTIFYMY